MPIFLKRKAKSNKNKKRCAIKQRLSHGFNFTSVHRKWCHCWMTYTSLKNRRKNFLSHPFLPCVVLRDQKYSAALLHSSNSANQYTLKLNFRSTVKYNDSLFSRTKRMWNVLPLHLSELLKYICALTPPFKASVLLWLLTVCRVIVKLSKTVLVNNLLHFRIFCLLTKQFKQKRAS